VEDGLAPFEFKTPMVPAIVIQPQTKKHHANENAVDHNRSGNIEHREGDGIERWRRRAVHRRRTTMMKSEEDRDRPFFLAAKHRDVIAHLTLPAAN
jgi:hypothetical protein